MSRRKPPHSEDDMAVWASVASTVKPFAGKRVRVTPKPKQVVAVRTAIPEPVRGTVMLPPLSVNTSAEVDAALHKRLVSGRLALDGRLDLHGMTQDEALAALRRFVTFSAHKGRRCLLVITGKSGVLRREMPRWLNGEKLRPLLLALCEAQPKDGGTGAFYVLLKRKKKA